MKYILGIDLGTSGTKTVLFSGAGDAVASALVEYGMAQPRNGWAEQNPQDWWNAAAKTIRAVLEKSGVDKNDVVSLGISGQMHGLVMLDKDGQVLRPSIIWCDQRTGRECAEITQKVGAERLIRLTANPALTGFTASKILWVKNNEPEIYARCRHILLPKDYVRYMLTGDFATEVSDASGMQLLDVPKRKWSGEVLAALQIDEALLAKVYESPEVTGHISRQAAQITGLSENTLVVGGAGDNAAAAVGTGVVRDGRAFTTIGTSGVVFAHTSRLSIDQKGRVHTFCCAVPGQWHVMGVTQAAGLSLKWFRDTFCGAEKETAACMRVDPYDLMNREAALSPVGANKLFYLPYLMGERTPHLDPDCRGVFFGLSAMHKKSDMIRAVMEGVSYSLRDCLGVLEEMGVAPEKMIACGGGGKSPLWRQMLADVFGTPVCTAQSTEGPALGAAILAGVGAGLFESVPTACDRLIRLNEPQTPNAEETADYARRYAVYRTLYPAMKDCFSKLGAL